MQGNQVGKQKFSEKDDDLGNFPKRGSLKKELEASFLLNDQIIDAILEQGSSYIIPDRMPKEEGFKVMVVQCILKAGLVEMHEIKTEFGIPNSKDRTDIFLEKYRYAIELKTVPAENFSISPRTRRNKENDGLAQAMKAKKAFGKVLLLFFTNHTDYAHHLEVAYRKYAAEGIFVRVVNYNLLIQPEVFGNE